MGTIFQSVSNLWCCTCDVVVVTVPVTFPAISVIASILITASVTAACCMFS